MTAAIDRLETRGLVVGKSTATDRRARIVELTPEGKRNSRPVLRKACQGPGGADVSPLRNREAAVVRVPEEGRALGRTKTR